MVQVYFNLNDEVHEWQADASTVTIPATVTYTVTPTSATAPFSLDETFEQLTPVGQAEPVAQPQPVVKKLAYHPHSLLIGGHLFTRANVQQAVDLLTASTANSVRRILVKAGNPLAIVDVAAIAAHERLYSDAFDTGKDKTKAAFLHHLRNALTGVDHPLPEDEYGYVTPVVAPQTWSSYDTAEMRACVAAVSAAFGRGRIIGRGAAQMSGPELNAWLTAWHGGDLDGAHRIEAATGVTTSPHHPGRNVLTRFIVWQPAVPGEVPAGEPITGSWPSPQVTWSHQDVDNYLIQARMAHPTHLTGMNRRHWVYAHLRGEKATVDRLSALAARRAAAGHPPRSADPIASVAPHRVDLDTFLAEPNVTAVLWGTEALDDYLERHGLETPNIWHYKVAAADEHLARQKAEYELADYRLNLRYAPQQPALGGFHRKAVLVDQFDRQWLFKPAPTPAARFRPEVEHEAHQLANAWGFRTAHSELVDFDGHYGQIQLLLPVERDLLGCTGAQFADLTEEQITAVACEHALDWALDNDDTHGGNMVILTDGTVIGIDKGRAWRYVGGWDGLSGTTAADTNCKVIYTGLYAAIAAGHLDRALVDRMYRAVIVTAHRMQALPDDALRAHLTRATANRPHYQPSSYQTPVAGAPTTAEELITQVTARKNNLVADMSTLWQRVYTAAGWTPPELHFPLGFNAQGHELYAGLFDPALHQAVTRTKSYGTAAFVAGTGIEDAHVLLWRERRPDGNYTTRGHFKVRADTLTAMSKHYADEWSTAYTGGKTTLDQYSLHARIVELIGFVNEAATGWNRGHWCGIVNDKLTHLRAALADLKEGAALVRAEQGPDPEGRRDATVAMYDLYQVHVETLQARVNSATTAREWEFPAYTWVPNPVPPAPPKPYTMNKVSLTRAAATLTDNVTLAADGELQLIDANLDANNLVGYMYLTTFDTGEQIEYQDVATCASVTAQGTVQFTIPGPDLVAGLTRIVDHLAGRGCILTPATPTDLELFYWRHLANVMCERADSKPDGTPAPAPAPGHAPNPAYGTFWALVDEKADDEQGMWRTAFADLTTGGVAAFLAAGGHQPRFGHQDLRRPGQPCGKPFWYRPDVTRTQWAGKKLLSMHYRNGPRYVLATGIAAATETRIRAFALWKCGQSSTDDLKRGSGAFVFTRANRPLGAEYNLYISPQVFTRTSTYSFEADKYGRSADRINCAYFDFDVHTQWQDEPNETMIKNAVTLLDDIEILVFKTHDRRADAIRRLARHGITAIRGIPLTTRFVGPNEHAIIAAANTVRATYTQPW